MFRTAPAAEPPVVIDPADDPIPITHLALDLPEPATGWLVDLERRGIEVMVDDIGRRSVPRDVARMLLAEQAEAEVRRREVVARNEQRAVEADRLRRASIWRGLPAVDLPVGVSASDAMLSAARAERPKRTSVLQDALAGGETVMHILEPQSAFLEDE
jgi:hypothetical protein